MMATGTHKGRVSEIDCESRLELNMIPDNVQNENETNHWRTRMAMTKDKTGRVVTSVGNRHV
jgi:hypothetical protein